MKASLMLAGVCLLAFTFTITECRHVINKKQTIPTGSPSENPTDSPTDSSCLNRSPVLQDCIDSLSSNAPALCSPICRIELLDYYERCNDGFSLDSITLALNVLCGAPDMPNTDDSCRDITSDLQECINAYNSYGSGSGSGLGSGDSLACSSECRSELEDYYERCTEGATLESFRDNYNALCGMDTCTNVPAECNNIPEACTSTCRSVLESYIVRCFPDDLENFRERYESLCANPDVPDSDDSCQNITSDLQECIDGFNNRNTTVTCSSHCRSELRGHYERCFETGLEPFTQSYNLLCDSPVIDNCLNITSGLEECLNNFTTGDMTACSSTCRSQLEGYFEMCVSDNLEAFREIYSGICDRPNPDDSCQNIPPHLTECFNGFTTSNTTVICSSNCRAGLEDYYKRCLGGAGLDNLRLTFRFFCDVPSTDDFCQNITSDLQECIDGFNNRNTTVTCSSHCRSELGGHYERCFETGLEPFTQSYNLLCDSPVIDNCLNITSGLEECLNNFTTGDMTACSSTCRSQLEGYFETCVPDHLEAFRQTYSSLCDTPSPDDSCQITSNLQECFDSVASDPTVMCSTKCWPELAGYYERCLGEVALDSLREVYSSICNIPDTPGIHDSCQLSNMNESFTDCINSLGGITSVSTGGDSLACSSECRYDIEDYIERCLDTGIAQAFINVYNIVCEEPSNESAPTGPLIYVQLSGSGVVVTVEAVGAESINIILRDSSRRRHIRNVVGSSASVEFSDLPSGLTIVRAKVKLPGGKTLQTEWQEITIPK